MGEYFTPTLLNEAGQIVAALQPEDYGQGDRLFGHTRFDTTMQHALMLLLSLDGGLRLVWAGDYYVDSEPGADASLFFLVEDRHLVRFDGLVFPDVEPNRPRPEYSSGCFAFICNIDKKQYIENARLGSDLDVASNFALSRPLEAARTRTESCTEVDISMSFRCCIHAGLLGGWHAVHMPVCSS